MCFFVFFFCRPHTRPRVSEKQKKASPNLSDKKNAALPRNLRRYINCLLRRKRRETSMFQVCKNLKIYRKGRQDTPIKSTRCPIIVPIRCSAELNLCPLIDLALIMRCVWWSTKNRCPCVQRRTFSKGINFKTHGLQGWGYNNAPTLPYDRVITAATTPKNLLPFFSHMAYFESRSSQRRS